MKTLSLLLIGCVLFLCSYGGVVQTAHAKQPDCCKKMMACSEKSSPKKNTSGDCNQPGCAMMFSCSICGFVVEEITIIPPPVAHTFQKPVAHYIQGKLAAYYADSWKPPKAC